MARSLSGGWGSDFLPRMILQRTTSTSRARLLSLVAAAVFALSLASTRAYAQEVQTATAAGAEGSILLGGGFGPAFFLNGGGAGFHLQFNASYAFKERLWGVFTPSFVFGNGGTLITIPFGVQYDVEIPSVPNLYVYPRVSIGFGVFTAGGSAAFAFIPEAGVKYVIEGKYFIAVEPFSLPIYIGDGTATMYRLNFLGGIYL
jgi:hypothetical protein